MSDDFEDVVFVFNNNIKNVHLNLCKNVKKFNFINFNNIEIEKFLNFLKESKSLMLICLGDDISNVCFNSFNENLYYKTKEELYDSNVFFNTSVPYLHPIILFGKESQFNHSFAVQCFKDNQIRNHSLELWIRQTINLYKSNQSKYIFENPKPLITKDYPKEFIKEKYNQAIEEYINTNKINYYKNGLEVEIPVEIISNINKSLNFSGWYIHENYEIDVNSYIFYKRPPGIETKNILENGSIHCRLDSIEYDGNKNVFQVYGKNETGQTIYCDIYIKNSLNSNDSQSFKFTSFVSIPKDIFEFCTKSEFDISDLLKFKFMISYLSEKNQLLEIPWMGNISISELYNLLLDCNCSYFSDDYEQNMIIENSSNKNINTQESYLSYINIVHESKNAQIILWILQNYLLQKLKDIRTSKCSTNMNSSFVNKYFDENLCQILFTSKKSNLKFYHRYQLNESFFEIRCSDYAAKYQVKNIFKNLENLLNDGNKLKYYEFKKSPVLEFTLFTAIKPLTWFKINIDSKLQIIYNREKRDFQCFKDLINDNPHTICDIELMTDMSKICLLLPESEWCFQGQLTSVSYDIESIGRGEIDDFHLNPISTICSSVLINNNDEFTQVDEKGRNFKSIGYTFSLRNSKIEDEYYTIETYKHKKNVIHFKFKDEKDLLKAWHIFLCQLNPDIIYGHYNRKYDNKAVLRRSYYLGLIPGVNIPSIGRKLSYRNYNSQSIFQSVAFGSNVIDKMKYKGLPLGTDTYVIFSKMQFKFESYSLDFISQTMLGKDQTKKPMSYKYIETYFWGKKKQNGILISYCLQDARLPEQLVNKCSFITTLVETSRIVGSINLNDILDRGVQAACDSVNRHIAMREDGINEKNINKLGCDIIIRDLDFNDESETPKNNHENEYEEYELNVQEFEKLTQNVINLMNDVSRLQKLKKSIEKKETTFNCIPTTDIYTGEKILDESVPFINKTNSDLTNYGSLKINNIKKIDIKFNSKRKKLEEYTYSGAVCFNVEHTFFGLEKRTYTFKNGEKKTFYYKNGIPVVVLDFASLYPSLMISYNYSHDTLLSFSEVLYYIKSGYLDPRDLHLCHVKGYKRELLYDNSNFKNQIDRQLKSEDIFSVLQEYLLTIYEDHPCYSDLKSKNQLIRIDNKNVKEIISIQKSQYFSGKKYIEWIKLRYLIDLSSSPIEYFNINYYGGIDKLFDISLIEKFKNIDIDLLEIPENFKIKSPISGNLIKIYLCTNEKYGMGIFPKTSVYLLSQRSLMKRIMNTHPYGSNLYSVFNGRQLALKLQANSMYGTSGTLKSNYRCIPNLSGSITTSGAYVITKAKEHYLNFFGDGSKSFNRFFKDRIDPLTGKVVDARVVAGDTDSFFVIHPMVKNSRDAMDFGLLLEKMFSNIFRLCLTFAFEKAILALIYQAKKHYAGMMCSSENNNDLYAKYDALIMFVKDEEERKRIFSLRDIVKKEKPYSEENIEIIKKVPELISFQKKNRIHNFFTLEGTPISYNYEYLEYKYYGEPNCWFKNDVWKSKQEWIQYISLYKKERFKNANESNDFAPWFDYYFNEATDEYINFNWVDACKFLNKGIELSRRGIPKYLKNTLNKFIHMIMQELNSNEYDIALNYIKSRYSDLLNGNVPVNELYLSKKYSKLVYKGKSKPEHIQSIESIKYADPKLGIQKPLLGDRLFYTIVQSDYKLNKKLEFVNLQNKSNLACNPTVAQHKNFPINYFAYANQFKQMFIPYIDLFLSETESLNFFNTSNYSIKLPYRFNGPSFNNKRKNYLLYDDNDDNNNFQNFKKKLKFENNLENSDLKNLIEKKNQLVFDLQKHFSDKKQQLSECYHCACHIDCTNFDCDQFKKRSNILSKEKEMEFKLCDIEDLIYVKSSDTKNKNNKVDLINKYKWQDSFIIFDLVKKI